MNLSLSQTALTLLYKTASNFTAAVGPLLVDSKRIERIPNAAYGEGPFSKLDVYRPRERKGKLPISLLVHGGGFRYFSKNSHAAAAARLAESGRIVFCIDYRLAPEHPFPEGLLDTMTAYSWMIENAGRFDGDPNRISLVGESSGANYCLSLCLHLFGIRTLDEKYPTPKVPAQKPKAAILHCGFYEVTDVERFDSDPRFHRLALARVDQIRKNYLPEYAGAPRPEWALADPLVVLRELNSLPARFPECLIPVGERDPVIGDSERLDKALTKLGQTDRLRVYPGVNHAFYTMPMFKQAKRCWTDIVAFLDQAEA